MGDEESGESPQDLVKIIKTLEHYEKIYGRSADGNDQKAIMNFRMFECKEKVRRLQTELQWVKEGRVSEAVCNQVIGKKRKGKYQTYEHWAGLMLMWIAAKRGT